MNFEYIICTVICFVPALVLHEVAHGFAAYKLGDKTAKMQGRLSLNPLKHIDPFGTVIMPLLLMIAGMPVFGYAKPVPYNPRYFKDIRKGELLVGLAGPAANLVLALIGTILLAVFFNLPELLYASSPALAQSLYASTLYTTVVFGVFPSFIQINLFLMFFNLLPIPPLDGSSIIGFFLPTRYLPQYYRVQQYALPIFLLACFVLPEFFGISPINVYLQYTARPLFNLLLSFV